MNRFSSLPSSRITTLGRRGPGDPVHLEAVVIAKHVERLVAPHVGKEQP